MKKKAEIDEKKGRLMKNNDSPILPLILPSLVFPLYCEWEPHLSNMVLSFIVDILCPGNVYGAQWE